MNKIVDIHTAFNKGYERGIWDARKEKVYNMVLITLTYIIVFLIIVWGFLTLVVPVLDKLLYDKVQYVPVPCDEEMPLIDPDREMRLL